MKRRTKSRVPLVVALSVLAVLSAIAYTFYVTTYTSPNSGQLVMDWRLRLHFLDARTQTNSTPPALIGAKNGFWMNHTLDSYGPSGYAPVSTRDDSGTIYIQSSVLRGYTFADFFNVWGQPFNMKCVPYPGHPIYCAGSEPVVYDTNNNKLYDSGDLIITPGTPISPGTPLTYDDKVRYVDSNNNGLWDPGETVVYDINNTRVYANKDFVIAGNVPAVGTSLKNDPRITFVDTDSNGLWDPPKGPPVMTDGNMERCINPGLFMSSQKDWLIILNSDAAAPLGGCKS